MRSTLFNDGSQTQLAARSELDCHWVERAERLDKHGTVLRQEHQTTKMQRHTWHPSLSSVGRQAWSKAWKTSTTPYQTYWTREPKEGQERPRRRTPSIMPGDFASFGLRVWPQWQQRWSEMMVTRPMFSVLWSSRDNDTLRKGQPTSVRGLAPRT